MIFCEICQIAFHPSEWEHHFHRHRHKAPLRAPELTGFRITIKETHMASIQGVALGTVTLTITLPTARQDGTAAQPSEVQSITILRDPGTGPATLATIANGTPAPFGATVSYVDQSPVTGTDAYSAFCTDTAGTQGATSLAVSVSVAGQTLAPLLAPTLTASNTGVAPTGEVITPSTVTLAPGGTQTFSASPAGVNWSAVSGTIDANGNYTAPSSGTSDTVNATSIATPSLSGQATVTITAAPQQNAQARK